MDNIEQTIRRASNKASKSLCKFHVSAIGLNHAGRVIGTATNCPRFSRLGGGLHAEMRLMRKLPKRALSTIILCRVGNSGDLRPIDPCKMCQKIADKMGIKIITVHSIRRKLNVKSKEDSKHSFRKVFV